MRKSAPRRRTKAVPKPKLAADRIRESARDLFYRQGIRAVGVDEIVTRAGVTKPSLYRSFASKDELAADYLRHMGHEGLSRLNATLSANPEDPRGQFRSWLLDLKARATSREYRGCGTTNAVVEYPDPKHPARKVAAEIKGKLRKTLAELAGRMGAENRDLLGDAMMLLLEGVYASGQLFGPGGPARVIVEAADALIDSHCSPRAECSRGPTRPS